MPVRFLLGNLWSPVASLHSFWPSPWLTTEPWQPQPMWSLCETSLALKCIVIARTEITFTWKLDLLSQGQHNRDLVKERRLLQEVYEGGEAELAHLPSRRQSLKLQNQVARQDNKGPGCGLNSAASANVCWQIRGWILGTRDPYMRKPCISSLVPKHPICLATMYMVLKIKQT